MEIEDYGKCFACGENNPIGLKLKFEFEGERFVASFTPCTVHQGYDDIIHGGILCTLLDEAMAKLVYEKGFMAVTGGLRVKFRKPARVNEELKVAGWIVSEGRRAIDCAAEVRNSDNVLIADATGRMIRVKDSKI